MLLLALPLFQVIEMFYDDWKNQTGKKDASRDPKKQAPQPKSGILSVSTQGAEGDGAAPRNHNMNSTRDINSHDIEQGHVAKSIMLHTDSVDTEGSSHTARDNTGEYELLEERMYKSIALGYG